MGFDTCPAVRHDAAAFVLGDIDAQTRARLVSHLDGCPPCRHEVTSLASAVDAMSFLAPAMEPSPGFVGRVLAAASADLVTASEDLTPPAWVSAPAARPRPVAIVARRRRTLTWLTGGAAVFGVLGAAFGSSALVGVAIAVALLAATYLGLVSWITHSRARHEIVAAFRTSEVGTDSFWRELQPRRPAGPRPDDRLASPVVAVRNTALLHFVLSYFLGWALTPVVGLIRMIRGDLTGLEQSPFLARIVSLQHRGREHSMRVLVAGATTVAVASGGGAVLWFSPGMAAAAPATYTVRAGDTLGAIAQRYGVSVSSLARVNGITDPNVLVPGHILQLGAAAPPDPGPTSR